MRAAIIVLAAGGCATPYQHRGIRGGYDDTQVAKDTYFVTFDGNGYTSMTDAQMGLRHRALELCPGGFTTLSGGGISTISQVVYQPNGFGGTTATTIEKPHAEATIRCNDDEAEATRPAPATASSRSTIPAPAAPLDPAGRRRAMAAQLQQRAANFQPPMAITTAGDEDEVLLLYGSVCGTGFLPGLVTQPGFVDNLRSVGFTRIECHNGARHEEQNI